MNPWIYERGGDACGKELELHIARQMVERMGGLIGFTTELGPERLSGLNFLS